MNATLARRRFLQLGAASALVGLCPRARAVDAKDRKLLFVLCAHGGASIIDSFLPIVDYDGGNPLASSGINVFPDWMVETVPNCKLRAVKLLDNYAYFTKPSDPMSSLLAHHGQDALVMTHTGTSVNHSIGQQRALNGNGVAQGRTLMESMALRHGAGLPLASVNMAIDGYARPGTDATVPSSARHALVTAPALFGIGTHGYRFVDDAPSAAGILRARGVRDQLESSSKFGRTFANEARRSAYLKLRLEQAPLLESANLVEKLLLLDPATIDPKYGLLADTTQNGLRATLPNLSDDRMEAQLALAFLLAYHGVSVSTVMGFSTEPVTHNDGSVVGAPVGFDFSHNLHRLTQSLMWTRTAQLVDKLVTLLKTYDYLGDPALGKMWDRSLIYVATEFGRDKTRPSGADSWGTGHDLNNGSLMLSPLLKGNAVYGGVDPLTGLTYGFDPATGAPDKNRTMDERDIYGVIAQALGLEVPNGTDYAGLVR
jgi:hypothetical protein